MTRLTPFDDELCVMVRSLTGKDPEIVETESYYTLKLDVSGKAKAEKKAIDDAICGRVGNRLVRATYTQFDAGKIEYGIMYNADYENIPVEHRASFEKPRFAEIGKRYCRTMKEVYGIFFDRQTADDVVAFCGNGIVEIPRNIFSPAKITFANSKGIFQSAIEGAFICTTDGNHYEILTHDQFVAMYEPKEDDICESKEDVIGYLNERFGTDIYMRCKKLNEEINELFQVVKSSGAKVLTEMAHNIDFIDELADVAIVLNHIAGIAGFDTEELEKIALGKIRGREVNPDYERKHPHKEKPDIRTKIAQKSFEVRQLQRSYFNSKDKIILSRCKQEEKELDALLMQYIDPQK